MIIVLNTAHRKEREALHWFGLTLSCVSYRFTVATTEEQEKKNNMAKNTASTHPYQQVAVDFFFPSRECNFYFH